MFKALLLPLDIFLRAFATSMDDCSDPRDDDDEEDDDEDEDDACWSWSLSMLGLFWSCRGDDPLRPRIVSRSWIDASMTAGSSDCIPVWP